MDANLSVAPAKNQKREELDFVSKIRTYAKRLACSIVQEVLDSNIHSVAIKSHVTTEEIAMLKDLERECLKSKPLGLKRLGIDEIAWVKGQGNYCAVLIDLDLAKPIAILKARTQLHVREVFTQWGIEILKQIEKVSIDLWKTYKNLVEQLMPYDQIVSDIFHVIKQVNEEIDRQRKKQSVKHN